MSEAKEDKEAQEIALNACDILVECGYTKPLCTLKLNDVSQLIKNATLHSAILKIKSELDQFVDGIDEAGVLDSIRKYPDLFRPLFVSSGTTLSSGDKLSFVRNIHMVKCVSQSLDSILDLLKIKLFSKPESELLKEEQATYVYFRDFLEEVEGKCNPSI